MSMSAKFGVRFLAAMGMALVATTVTAAARPDLRQMTCAQAQAMVKRDGAVVFTTGQYTYFRFVADRGYCDRDQVTEIRYSATKDNKQCPVAYECTQPLFLHWND